MDGRRVASLMCMCFAIAADPAMWIIWPVLVAILLALAVMWVVSHIVVILLAMAAMSVIGIMAVATLWKINSRGTYSPRVQVTSRLRQEEVSAGQWADCLSEVNDPETSNHYHLHLHGVDAPTAEVLVKAGADVVAPKGGHAPLSNVRGGDAMIR